MTGPALRIEKARYVSEEGKTPAGCPMAKYVVRRSGLSEKFTVICKKRHGHTCQVNVQKFFPCFLCSNSITYALGFFLPILRLQEQQNFRNLDFRREILEFIRKILIFGEKN